MIAARTMMPGCKRSYDFTLRSSFMTHRVTAIVSISIALLAAAAMIAISQNSVTFAGRGANLTAKTGGIKPIKSSPTVSIPSLDRECSLIAAGSQTVKGCGDAFKNDGNGYCFGHKLVKICASYDIVSVYGCQNGCEGGACLPGMPTDAKCGDGKCEPGEYICGFGVIPPNCNSMTGDERERCEKMMIAMENQLEQCRKNNPNQCEADCDPPA